MDSARSRPAGGFFSMAPAQLTPKDKRHQLAIEKTLASFVHLTEWADYILFLLRLQKALLLGTEPAGLVLFIPCSRQILLCLQQCLLPELPSGVHQRTLSIYEQVFSAVQNETLNAEISLWLPGLLPVLSFGSMLVKPQLLTIYKKLVADLDPHILKGILRPCILLLFAGLDDENSEVFSDVLHILDAYKSRMADNEYFWQNVFHVVVSAPEKRLGALNWCNARLPSLTALPSNETAPTFSVEATACLSPNPSLLLRAFSAVLASPAELNSAADVLVIRGFFDLLLLRLPLGSPVLTSVASREDTKLLLVSCCRTTLRKDMSLNRRLWAWLLGPAADDPKAGFEFFEKNALPPIEEALLELIGKSDLTARVDSFKISLLLIRDRWEISQMVTPRLFRPIIEASYASRDSAEVISAAKAFFDEVDAVFIWQYLTCELILGADADSLRFLEFVMRNFDFPEEERSQHLPIAIACFLLSHKLGTDTVTTLSMMVEYVLPQQFPALEKDVELERFQSKKVIDSIKEYYSIGSGSESELPPVYGPGLSLLVIDCLKNWYIQSLEESEQSSTNGPLSPHLVLALILADFLAQIPNTQEFCPIGLELYETVIRFLPYTFSSGDVDRNVSPFFGIVKLCRYLLPGRSLLERARILKIVLSNLFVPLVSAFPANNQVDVVRAFFDLQLCFDRDQVESGIVEMLLQLPLELRAKAFYMIWTHSADISDAESILQRPLQVVLDDLMDSEERVNAATQKFVHSASTDGTVNRLLKLLTDPLLGYDLMKLDKKVITPTDDLGLFAYDLGTMVKVIRSNEKILRDLLSHEFVSSESSEKANLFISNGWPISTFKALMLCVIKKFIGLKISKELVLSKEDLQKYVICMSNALELLAVLLIGSEQDFEDYVDAVIDTCRYLLTDAPAYSYDVETAVSHCLRCINHFIDLARSSNLSLSIFAHGEKSEHPPLVAFIGSGIASSSSTPLLESWLGLLRKSIYSFGEEVFSVLIELNDVLIQKISTYFICIQNYAKSDPESELELSLNLLLSGLEDLLTISHSYLLPSGIHNSDRPANANATDPGFFNNVISGVFLIESPTVRTTEQNRYLSLVITFQDAARVAFDIWAWADSKPVVPASIPLVSLRSVSYLASKLKFRSRKLLENLCALERQEVVEVIIEAHTDIAAKVKILHVLDNGRSQVTLPHIVNSLISRCHPQVLGEKQLSSMNCLVSPAQLSEFLVAYYNLMDADVVNDVWDTSINFIKENLANPGSYKDLLITCLRIIKVLAWQDTGRNGRSHNKELSVQYLSILGSITSLKAQGDLDELARKLVPFIEEFGPTLKDSDKVNTAVTTVVSNAILPAVRNKTKSLGKDTLLLLETIGALHPIASWQAAVGEIFGDSLFFAGIHKDPQMKQIMRLWIQTDHSRTTDLVNRITPAAAASTNIFVWNDNSEVEDRINVIRQIAYLVMVQPKNLISKHDEIFSRLNLAVNDACPPSYAAAVLDLLRAIALRSGESQLAAHWQFIVRIPFSVFESVLSKRSKECLALKPDELTPVLAACKLLDQLLLLNFDGFAIFSWLFVSSGKDQLLEDSQPAVVDRVARHVENLLADDEPLAIALPMKDLHLVPVLRGVRKIAHLALLKKFFGILSYINSEREFAMLSPDLTVCDEDVYEDLSA